MIDQVEAESENAAQNAAVSYSYKPSLMGGIWTFHLMPDALAWSIGPVAGTIPYRDIKRIRLGFRPVTMQSYRFLAEIWADRSPKLPVVSASWKSLTEQERQDDAYTRFILALHEKIAEAGGTPKLLGGAVVFLYWPGAAIFCGICLATVVLVFRAIQQGEWAGSLFLLAFFSVLVWQLGRFFKRNFPRRYTLGAVPSDLLPMSARQSLSTKTEHVA